MEAAFPILCFSALAIGLAVGFYSRQRKIRLLLQPLVDAHGAEWVGWGLNRRAAFRLHGVPILVSVAKRGPTGDVLRLWANLEIGDLTCRIRTRRVFDMIRRWFGQGILTGQGSFDEMFFVEGSDSDRLRTILNVNAQAALILMYNQLGHLRLDHGVLEIEAVLPSLTLVENANVLIERFLGRHSDGVEFLDESSGPVRICSQSACPVCGESLDGKAPVIHCRGCQTPHHKDCWRYAKGCAIYACGGKKLAASR